MKKLFIQVDWKNDRFHNAKYAALCLLALSGKAIASAPSGHDPVQVSQIQKARPATLAIAASTTNPAADLPGGAAHSRVKYRSGKDLDFEQLVIDGQLKRPDLMVVTGDNEENTNGLLRLRENFIDRMGELAGQENP